MNATVFRAISLHKRNSKAITLHELNSNAIPQYEASTQHAYMSTALGAASVTRALQQLQSNSPSAAWQTLCRV